MTIAQQQLTNAKVALFFDPVFVETGGGALSEGSNVKAALEAKGHVVTTFVGTSTTSWMNATKDADVLVIPETGNTVTPLTLSKGALFFLRQFVSDGGTLIVHGEDADNVALMNLLFDLTLAEVASVGVSTRFIAAPTYEGFPLPDNNITDALQASSLPSFAQGGVYRNAAGDATVAPMQYGKGQFIYLGWDWNDALPVPGVQDGGWNGILHSSVSRTDLNPNGRVIGEFAGNDKIFVVDPGSPDFGSTDLDDFIRLGKGTDKAFCGGGHDIIDGGKHKDKLHAGDGDDFISGGRHRDQLWGDAGGDYFLFDQKPGRKHADKVNDFIDGQDTILLKQSKFDALTVGEMTALQFSALIDYRANGWLKYDGEKFAKLQSGALAIDHTDFLVA